MPILSGKARVAGIVGWPVSHSRSPRLHGYWLRQLEIDGVYVPLPVRPESFPSAIRGLRDSGFAGLNVTIPHKVAAFDVCDRVDPSAQRAGAVNTLSFVDGQITGSNTDGRGFIASVQALGIEMAGRRALVLGAGGASRAIAAALLDLGVAVTVANRTQDRAEQLAGILPGLHVLPWTERNAALDGFELLVNATSLGMTGQPALELSLDSASPALVVCDIVYVPLETPLLAAARTRGLQTVDGLGMLLHQAVPGFHSWFGVLPRVDDALRDFVLGDHPGR